MWYIFQTIVWSTIVYKYVTEIAPHERVGAIMLFATLLTYLVTLLVSKLIDVAYRVIGTMHIKLVGPKLLRTVPNSRLTLRGKK